MAFTKGVSGNPSGRPKGSNNKISENLRIKINEFLNNQFDPIIKDLECLPLKDRIKLYCDLLQYALPKMQATSYEINFDDLSEQQLDEILQKLINKAR